MIEHQLSFCEFAENFYGTQCFFLPRNLRHQGWLAANVEFTHGQAHDFSIRGCESIWTYVYAWQDGKNKPTPSKDMYMYRNFWVLDKPEI